MNRHIPFFIGRRAQSESHFGRTQKKEINPHYSKKEEHLQIKQHSVFGEYLTVVLRENIAITSKHEICTEGTITGSNITIRQLRKFGATVLSSVQLTYSLLYAPLSDITLLHSAFFQSAFRKCIPNTSTILTRSTTSMVDSKSCTKKFK